MKIIVRTEIWNTSKGKVTKAVVRDANGRLVGATNQTAATPSHPTVVVVGAK